MGQKFLIIPEYWVSSFDMIFMLALVYDLSMLPVAKEELKSGRSIFVMLAIGPCQIVSPVGPGALSFCSSSEQAQYQTQ
jgi:hypothetical protein